MEMTIGTQVVFSADCLPASSKAIIVSFGIAVANSMAQRGRQPQPAKSSEAAQ
jgi:hypothetical protein